jgi:hypothetical protein
MQTAVKGVFSATARAGKRKLTRPTLSLAPRQAKTGGAGKQEKIKVFFLQPIA